MEIPFHSTSEGTDVDVSSTLHVQFADHSCVSFSMSLSVLQEGVQSLIHIIITSAKEVIFSLEFVCLSVCLSVSNITRKVVDGFG